MKTTRIRKGPSGPEETISVPETSSDLANTSSVPGATVTEALDALAGAASSRPEIALWVLDNDLNEWPVLLGYTAAQIAGSYSGAPAVALNFAGYEESGVGHGLSVLGDGLVIVSTSEGESDPDNGGESWYVIADPVGQFLQSPLVRVPPVIRVRADSIAGFSPGFYGARTVCVAPDGRAVLARDQKALVEVAALLGVPDYRTAAIVTNSQGVNGWDCAFDSEENFWLANGSTINAITLANLEAGGAATVVKSLSGTNISTGGSEEGIGGIAFDLSGGLWAFDSASQSLKYWDASVMAGLTGTPSNAAPTRVLTSSAITEGWSCVLGVEEDCWIVEYSSPGRLHHFTAAQLAAGGDQAPDRTIVTPTSYLITARFAPGFGNFLR